MNKRIRQLIMTELTVSVPVAGAALGNLCECTSYATAAKTGKIGNCKVLEVAGKKRVATADIRRELGLDRVGSNEAACRPRTHARRSRAARLHLAPARGRQRVGRPSGQALRDEDRRDGVAADRRVRRGRKGSAGAIPQAGARSNPRGSR